MQYQLILYSPRISQNHIVAKQIFSKRYDISKPNIILNILQNYSLYPAVSNLEYSTTNTGTQISNFVCAGVSYVLVFQKISVFSQMISHSFFGV